MGSLSRLIKEKGGQLEGVKTEQVRVQQIHYTKLKESRLNFYSRSGEEVEELADTMIIAGGILQPLIVRKTDMSEYEILAGHKRRRASIYNVERGYKEYEFLPCIVIDMSGLMAKKISEKILAEQGDTGDDQLLDMIAEYIVICTNNTSSERSDYEKMMQAVRLSKILPLMLENEELKGRALRTEIAKEMKCSDGQVGRYQGIYNNLVPEAMERFKDGRIKFSVAYGLSGLDSGGQQSLLKKQQITMADIELFKQEKSKETVSKLDTEKVSNIDFLKVEEDKETVSKLDTEKIQPEDSVEYSKYRTYLAFQHIFDDVDSGFPVEVREELFDVLEHTGNVSLMTDIFDRALPFENRYIKIERVFGYSIYFRDEGKKMTLALWPFWNDFIGRYRYKESLIFPNDLTSDTDAGQNPGSDEKECSPAAVPDEETEKTAASEEKEIVQTCGVSYTQEDVMKIYEEQERRIRQVEYAALYGELTETDAWQMKKARIIMDGISYILKAFGEGSIC